MIEAIGQLQLINLTKIDIIFSLTDLNYFPRDIYYIPETPTPYAAICNNKND
jgi:hypothetical protein